MEDSNSRDVSEKTKPPFGAVRDFSDFLDLAKRIKIEKVDIQFIKNHKISSKGNESKIVTGLKFLGLIKEDGSATDKMKDIGLAGEESQKNLENIVRKAYSELFDTIKNFEEAKPEDIVNCFRGDSYGMAPSTAKKAARVFVFLAEKSGVTLSKEITDGLLVDVIQKKVRKNKLHTHLELQSQKIFHLRLIHQEMKRNYPMKFWVV